MSKKKTSKSKVNPSPKKKTSQTKSKKTSRNITGPKKKKTESNSQNSFNFDFVNPLIWFLKFLVILGFVGAFVIFYQVLIVFQFPKTIIHKLPADNTVAVVEWVQKLPLSQKENLVQNIPQNTLNYLLYFEDNYLDQSYSQALRLVKPESKAFAKLKYQNELQDVFVFSFTEQSKFQFLQIFKPINSKWKAFFIDNDMYVCQDLDLLEFLGTNFISLDSNPSFQDAYYNIPKQNFASAYLNLSLLENKPNSILGVTVASLRPEEEGMYLSTYTNPSESGFDFYATEFKYQADLLNLLPANPNYVFGGLELGSRLDYFLTEANQGLRDLEHFLVSQNLGNEFWSEIKLFLDNELAFASYAEGDYLFVLRSNYKLEDVLSHLEDYQAYLNSKPETHLLESGTIAENLVPNYDLGYTSLDEHTYDFELIDSDKSLILYKNSDLYYLSNSPELIQRVKTETTTFADKLAPDPKMFEIADDFLYLDSSFVEQTLSGLDNFKLRKLSYPSLQSIGNYFQDGIQTVHLLKW